MLRAISGIVGLAIIAAMAHASVQAYGGYDAPVVPMILSLAAGLAVGAAAIGHCWHRGWVALAVLLSAACVCGEAYTLMVTAERTIASRDAKQAPLVEADRERKRAEQRVADALTKVGTIGETPRLKRAVEAKATADAAVIAKSAERACAVNCRALLEQQVHEAQREVDAARHEVEQARAKANKDVEAAKTALAALPPPLSSSPLADRLGFQPWAVDIGLAVLASFAANGLGAFLVAFAVHGVTKAGEGITIAPNEIKDLAPIQATKEITPEPAPRPIAVTRPGAPVTQKRNPRLEADQFAKESFRPNPKGRIALAEIRGAYRKWCEEKGREPLPDKEIGAALNALFSSVGLERDGFHMVGIERSKEAA